MIDNGHADAEPWLDDKQGQLAASTILLSAATEACRVRDDIKYSVGTTNMCQLSKGQQFLCKLAQICDSNKGGTTATALVCLNGEGGPEYIFACNSRKSVSLEQTKQFLSELLQLVAANSQAKKLKEQILSRILDFNRNRLNVYLGTLTRELRECLAGRDDADDVNDNEPIKRLLLIQELANVIDRHAEDRYLADCATLIKSILQFSAGRYFATLESFARDDNPRLSYSWRQVRHCLGRLLSFNSAAHSIAEAYKIYPHLFVNFRIDYIQSSSEQPYPIHQGILFNDIISKAIGDREVPLLTSYIDELRRYGLLENVQRELEKSNPTTLVHSEVLLRGYLIRNNRLDPSQYWDKHLFIATSKPPCRLCHFYFENVDDFQVQSSHMNVYSRWRLPDGETDEVLLNKMIVNVQGSILEVLEQKAVIWRRNDSTTNSYIGPASYVSDQRSDITDFQSVDCIPEAANGGAALTWAEVLEEYRRPSHYCRD